MTNDEYMKFAASEYRAKAGRREHSETRPRERIERIDGVGAVLDVEVLTASGHFDAIGLVSLYRPDRARPGELYYCGKILLGRERIDILIDALTKARARLAWGTKP